MVFVNERLTPEQRTEFAKKEIKNPVPHVFGILKPLYWTIDYDNNDMRLIGAGKYREFPDETYTKKLEKKKEIETIKKEQTRASQSFRECS